MMMDFLNHNLRDHMLYVNYSKTYCNYVMKAEQMIDPPLNTKAQKTHEIVSMHNANGVRPEEPTLIRALVDKNEISLDELNETLMSQFQVKPLDDKKLNSVLRNVNFLFMKENHNRRQVSLQERYNIKLVYYDFNIEMITRTESFNQMVREPIFIEYLNDQLEYSKQVYLSHLQESQEIDGFLLYQKYTRKDIFRILGWEENPVAQNVGEIGRAS